MANPLQLFDAVKTAIPFKKFVFPDSEVATAPVLHGPDGTPLLTPANPGTTRPAGSTGFEWSANGVAVPTDTPLLTIPANPNRLAVEIQNQSAVQIQVVRDNGSGTQATSILLSPGTAAGQAGRSWSSNTFRGRVRVYAPSGSQVAAYED